MAATTHTITLPEELLAQVKSAAEAEHRSVDEVLAEAATQYLEERSWAKILGYGQKRAMDVGLTEDDIDRAIAESRDEQRGR